MRRLGERRAAVVRFAFPDDRRGLLERLLFDRRGDRDLRRAGMYVLSMRSTKKNSECVTIK